MCGICGYFGRIIPDDPLPLEKLSHRGPDGRGETMGPGYRFGHTRLAIIDVAGGGQPMYNEDGTVCITFNGEIYNYRALREGLRGKHVFRTESDTEVIVHLYEEEGPAGLKKLDGMFALAIAAPGTAIMVRDPLGIKPLYYRVDEDGIRFASEIKAFPSAEGLEEFPPGHLFRADRGLEPYYELPQYYREDLDWPQALGELRRRLARAVEKRLMSDVPLGTFLSGGLDSSLISALAKEAKEELHTFSVTLGDSPDRHYAAMASRYLGTIHHEYVLTPEEMWAALPEVIYHLESFDRSLVRSAVPNYFLAKLASEHVKVVLTGEGADELFAGYAYLDRFPGWDDLHRELHAITAALHNTNLQRVDRMTMAHGLEGRVPFLDREVVAWGLSIPPWFKKDRRRNLAKWCLRAAFSGTGLLPEEIIWRGKEKFAEGTGVAAILAAMAEERVRDADYGREIALGIPLRSKEEYYYFQIFRSYFGRGRAVELVGRSRS